MVPGILVRIQATQLHRSVTAGFEIDLSGVGLVVPLAGGGALLVDNSAVRSAAGFGVAGFEIGRRFVGGGTMRPCGF